MSKGFDKPTWRRERRKSNKFEVASIPSFTRAWEDSDWDDVGKQKEPDEAIKIVNPHYGESIGYIRNCQTTAMAFEMQMRGFDVEATDNDSLSRGMRGILYDDSYFNLLSREAQNRFDNPFHKFGSSDFGSTDVCNPEKLEKSILRGCPDGSRGFLLLESPDNGHLVNFVVNNRKVTVYDASVGTKVDIKGQIQGYNAHLLNGETMSTAGFTMARWTRVDDIEVFDRESEKARRIARKYFRKRL